MSRNTAERLKLKLKQNQPKQSLPIPEDYVVREEFSSHAKKIMNEINEYQQVIIDSLGQLTQDDSLEQKEKKDLIEELWRCRQSQLKNIGKQAMHIGHQVSYILTMAECIEDWMKDGKRETLTADYDLAMINADLGEAFQLLFLTESNLNHNYRSQFDGWGKKNTTLTNDDA